MSDYTYSQDYTLQVDPGAKVTLAKQNDTDFEIVVLDSPVPSTTVDASNSASPVFQSITIRSNSSAYANSFITCEFAANSFGDTSSQCNLCFNLTNPGGDSLWSITGTTSQGDNQSIFKDINNAGVNKTVEVQVATAKNPSVNPSQAPVLDPNMVFLLDKTDDAMLFRGNAPLGEYKKDSNPIQLIDFPIFKTALEDAYKKATSEEMPSQNYELCVVALLSPSNGNILSPEYQSFGGEYNSDNNNQDWYPALNSDPANITSLGYTGRICQWNINPAGTSDGPYVTMVQQLAEDLGNWVKSGLTDSTGNPDKNAATKRIIYIHCSSGHDRTGMASSTYVANKKIVDSNFANGSTFEIADLVASYLMGTTLNHIPYQGGHYKQTVYNVDTKTMNANKSRCFLISTSYDQTVSWVADEMAKAAGTSSPAFDLTGTDAVSGDSNYKGEGEKDAYVEPGYVWKS